jgi:hypothetical protein
MGTDEDLGGSAGKAMPPALMIASRDAALPETGF